MSAVFRAAQDWIFAWCIYPAMNGSERRRFVAGSLLLAAGIAAAVALTAGALLAAFAFAAAIAVPAFEVVAGRAIARRRRKRESEKRHRRRAAAFREAFYEDPFSSGDLGPPTNV